MSIFDYYKPILPAPDDLGNDLLSSDARMGIHHLPDFSPQNPSGLTAANQPSVSQGSFLSGDYEKPPGFQDISIPVGQYRPEPVRSGSTSDLPAYELPPGYVDAGTVSRGQYLTADDAVKRSSEVDQRIELAKELAKPKYFLENDIDRAVEIPVSERPRFLQSLYQEALKLREENEARGTLSGMWDQFKLARGRSAVALFTTPDTLGIDFETDEDIEFVNRIMDIRTAVTNPENQGMVQGAFEGAASLAPDMLAMVALGMAGGPKAAAAYSYARSASDLEKTMADIEVSSEIRKPLAAIGAAPIAALDMVGAGAVFRPIKTEAVQGIQDAIAAKTVQMLGDHAESRILKATGNYASDLTVEIAQEFAQGIVEASTASLGKAIEEKGLTEDVKQTAISQFKNNIASVLDATLPMAILVGAGRGVESAANINLSYLPEDLRYFKDASKNYMRDLFREKKVQIEKIVNKEEPPSRKDIEELGITTRPNKQKRNDIKDDLRQIIVSNSFYPESRTQVPPAIPPMDVDQAVQQQLSGGQNIEGPTISTPARLNQYGDEYASETDFQGDVDDSFDFNTFSREKIQEEESQRTRAIQDRIQKVRTEVSEMSPSTRNKMINRFELDKSQLKGLKGDERKAARDNLLESFLYERQAHADRIGISVEEFDQFVDEYWKYQKEVRENNPIYHRAKEYLATPGKYDSDRMFPYGGDISKLDYNKLRETVSKVQEKLGTDKLSGSTPKRSELELKLVSDLYAADELPGLDLSASDLYEAGIVPSNENPSDFLLNEMARMVEEQIYPKQKWSTDFMDEATAAYEERTKGRPEDRQVAEENADLDFFGPDLESDLEKRGFFGALGAKKTRGHYLDKDNSGEARGLMTMVVGPRVVGRMFEAGSVDPKRVGDHMKDISEWLYNTLVKRSPYLDVKNNMEHADLENEIRRHDSESRAVPEETGREIEQVLYDLTPTDRFIFTFKILIDDLARQINNTGQLTDKIGLGTRELQMMNELRFGFESIQDVMASKAKMDKLVELSRYSAVKDALQKRQNVIVPPVTEAVRLGILPEEALDDPMAYFHRQVLAHHQVRSLFGGTPQVPGRGISGYLIRRKNKGKMTNEEFDHSTNYVQSEMEWLSKVKIDILNARFKQMVKDKYDRTKLLQSRADFANEVTWYGGERKYEQIIAKRQESRDLDREKAMGMLSNSDYKKQKAVLSGWLDQNDPARPFMIRKKVAEMAFRREANIPEDVEDIRPYLSKVNKENPSSVAAGYARGWFKAHSEQKAEMMKKVGLKYKTIDDMMYESKEDLVRYAGFEAPGNKYAKISAVENYVVDSLEQGVVDTYGLTKEDLREALVVVPEKAVIIPKEMADQLDYESRVKPHKWGITKAWQMAVLLSPHKLPGYMFINKLGDTEVTGQATDGSIEGYRRALKHLAKAVELSFKIEDYKKAIARAKVNGKPIPEKYQEIHDILTLAIKEGVIDSSLTVDQLERGTDMKRFLERKDLLDKMNPAEIVKLWFDVAGTIAQTSENMNRLGVFMFYRDALMNNKTFSYANSSQKYIDTIRKTQGDDAAAAKMAIDLIGNYQQSTPFVEMVSANFMPFFKFTAINTAREVRLTVNNLKQIKREIIQQKKLKPGSVFKLSTQALRILGKIGLKIAGPMAIYKLSNMLLFPGAEDELSENEKRRSPLIVSVDPHGNPTYIRGFSTRGDALDVIGGNTFLAMFRLYLDGKIDAETVLSETGSSAANKMVGMVTPALKSPFEVATGKSLFPDMFNPRSADRAEMAAGNLMSIDEYRAIMGTVTGEGQRARPGKAGPIPWLFRTVTANKQITALNDTYGMIETFLKSKGEPQPSFGISKSRFMKYAVQYNDRKAFMQARQAYLEDGGTEKAFLRGLDNVDPVKKMRDDLEKEFTTKYLNQDEANRVAIGRDYASTVAATMFKWWSEAEMEESGKLSDKVVEKIGSEISGIASRHSKRVDSKGRPWSVSEAETAKWLIERDISLNDAIGYLRDYYKSKDNVSPATRARNLRLARSRLAKQYRLLQRNEQ